MQKVGIVYAISRSAGEYCKKQFELIGYSSSEIAIHECPPSEYKIAANDVSKITKLLCHSIDELVKEGAKIIIIAANSVHRAFDSIDTYVQAKHSYIKLISIIDTAVNQAIYLNLKKIVVLGSNSTIQSNIYQDKLKQVGMEVLLLSEEDQSFINALIISEINLNTITDNTKEAVIRIIQKFQKIDCIGVILACTELPLIFNSKNLGIPAIDTGRALVLAAHEFKEIS